MAKASKMKLGFIMNGVGFGWADWRHPDMPANAGTDFQWHARQTLCAERGKFDYVFIADGVTTGRVAPENIPFYLVALFVLPIPVRMTLTWIYNSSGRSVPIAGLYHAGLGVAAGAGFLPLIAPSVDPVMVYAGFAALAAVVFVGSRGRLGLPAGPGPVVIGKEVAAAA